MHTYMHAHVIDLQRIPPHWTVGAIITSIHVHITLLYVYVQNHIRLHMYMHTRTETFAYSRFTNNTTTLAQWIVSIITCTHVHTQHNCTRIKCTHTSTHTHAHVHKCTRTHMHTYTHALIHMHTYTNIHTALGLQEISPHRHGGQ